MKRPSTKPKPNPAAAAAARSLADIPSLRGATIDCLRCEQPRPMADATRFRAHWVCVGCTTKLQQTPAKKPQPRSTES